jgi:neutral ceramidase
MNRLTGRYSVIVVPLVLLVGLLLGCQHPQHPATAPESLQLGTAEVDITPPVGFRMAGYFDERISTGIQDPLHAKAFVLQQGPEQVALVFCDLLGLSLNVTTNARAQASRQLGIPVTNIMICATHSHTGPLFDDIRRSCFHQAALSAYGIDPQETIDYPAFLVQHLVQVIGAAQAQMRPVQLAAGSVQQEGLTFNRRYWLKNGKVVFNPGRLNPNIVRPAGPTDPEVGIIQARNPADGHPFAGITTFAVHSDTVGGTLFSADYEYYLEQTLHRAYGPSYLSAFGLGTCGDLNHIDVYHPETLKGLAVTEHIGSTLGEAAINASKQLRPLSRPSLAVRSTTYAAPLQEVSPQQLAEAKAMTAKLGDPHTPFLDKVAAVKTLDLASRGATVPMEVQVFRLDRETALVCLPGELFVELGLAIKHNSPFKNTLVLTVCNDRPSYVPTRKAFAEGSYEVNNARVKPGTGEALVQTALELLQQLK